MDTQQQHARLVRLPVLADIIRRSRRAVVSCLAIAWALACWPMSGVVGAAPPATLLEAKAFPLQGPNEGLEPEVLDFRYAPLHWQACIGLPLDPYKSIVGSDGGLYYDFGKGPYKGRYFGVHTGQYFGFHLRVLAALQAEGKAGKITQTLLGPRVPVVITQQRTGDLLLRQEAWAAAPQGKEVAQWSPRRVDYLWLKLKNVGSRPVWGALALRIDGKQVVLDKTRTRLVEADHPDKAFATISSSPAGTPVFVKEEGKNDKNSVCLILPTKPSKRYESEFAPGEEFRVLLALPQGPSAAAAIEEKDAAAEQQRAADYWTGQAGLPYDRITVPDRAMQQLLDSCIRNIYQAREIRDGRPLFQVGPTLYRGTWAADGAFIMETVAYLGRADEARIGLENQVERDQGPQGVTFSKQLGLRLWMIWRHAQLTGDWQWLQRMWPCVQRNVKQIIDFRQTTRSDPQALNFGLMPPGTGDGGLGGVHLEYTNVYWTLAGLRAAIEMADKIHRPDAAAWKTEYQDYWNCFERARRRDQVVDAAGNLYLPVVMKGQQPQAPQRRAWAFLQSVYPGRIFAADDRLMTGTLAMLDANQREGLIYGTGWIADGIWNYAGSFYAHAHLWQGHGRKGGRHALRLRQPRLPAVVLARGAELQGRAGELHRRHAPQLGHAELIRLVRHMVILERGNELHLLESLPRSWTKAGNQTRLVQVPTSFGPMDLTLTVAQDGKTARLEVRPPRREPPEKIVVHLEQFGHPVRGIRLGERDMAGRPLQVPLGQPSVLTLELAD